MDKTTGFNDTYCSHKDCKFNQEKDDDRCNLSQEDVFDYCPYAEDINIR